ncbi:hypothetical protein ACFSL6_13200 [Paenibacillus thailandensis]|uniref:Uncharacterized protein n=1 Tax=Paenibacillus thailandensis TaxID=393250 RepID=A0ABW5QXB3_9BACL
MARLTRLAAVSVILASIAMGTGCGAARTPDEWLSMTISGLEGTDQYVYEGQSVTSLSNGVTYSPKAIKGVIVDHKELATQTNAGVRSVSPSDMLLSLQKVNKTVSFGPEQAGRNRLSLKVAVAEEDAKKLWSGYIRNEFEQLALNTPDNDVPYKAEWEQELERSRKELESRLATLSAQTDYEIIVDRSRMLPIELHETSVLAYAKKGGETEEKRDTVITFSSFGNADSEP